jgi:hypothetical protein
VSSDRGIYRQSVFRPAKASFAWSFSQSDQVLFRFRLALQHKSGPRIALPAHRLYYPVARYVASVDHTGLLRRSARCSGTTQRARMQQRPSPVSDRLRFCMCGRVRLWLECGPVEKEKRPPPSRQRATWLSACRRRAKRPSALQHQACKRGGEDIAKGLLHLILVRSVTGEPRRLDAWSTRFHCIKQQARCAT